MLLVHYSFGLSTFPAVRAGLRVPQSDQKHLRVAQFDQGGHFDQKHLPNWQPDLLTLLCVILCRSVSLCVIRCHSVSFGVTLCHSFSSCSRYGASFAAQQLHPYCVRLC